MDPFDNYLNNLLNQNKKNFAGFTGIKWLSPYAAPEANEIRSRLTEKLAGNWLFKGTKPYHKNISKGCEICGSGFWSCLFITNKCNANCFYCPSSQLKDETPATQSLTFDTAEGYADYINFLKFRGVSFSGGEPLLYFDRTLRYLKQIRKMCSPDIYIWLYTNGLKAEKDIFHQLADAGLNEVRFDIGATNYRLEKVHIAKGIIPNITIEIPAIPEKKEKIKHLLPEMIKAGVTNLNLHQLRLTNFNAPKLIPHNYTCIPAEKPVVMESELAALEILNYAKEKDLDIGINYCSFWFKNRFQPAGFRRQLANALQEPSENITEKGFIRNYTGKSIEYKAFAISENTKPGENSTKVELPHKTFYIRRETAMKEYDVDPDHTQSLKPLLSDEPVLIPTDELLFRVWQMEYIERGLREY